MPELVEQLGLERYVTPAEFEDYARAAREKGFLMVSSSPLTRSSYHADEDFQQLAAARARRFHLESRVNQSDRNVD